MASLVKLMSMYSTLSENRTSSSSSYKGMEVYLSIGGLNATDGVPPTNAYSCNGNANHSTGYGKWGVNTRGIEWEDIVGKPMPNQDQSRSSNLYPSGTYRPKEYGRYEMTYVGEVNDSAWKQTHGEAVEFKIRSIGNRGAYIGNSYNESPYDVNTEIVRIVDSSNDATGGSNSNSSGLPTYRVYAQIPSSGNDNWYQLIMYEHTTYTNASEQIPLYLKTTYHSSPNARSYQHFVFEITQYNTYTAPPIPAPPISDDSYVNNFNKVDSSEDGDGFVLKNSDGDKLAITADTVFKKQFFNLNGLRLSNSAWEKIKMMIVENAGNPYNTNDIRHRMWKQNKQAASETRGHVGYVLVKSKYMTDYHNGSVYAMLENGGNKTVYLHRAPY